MKGWLNIASVGWPTLILGTSSAYAPEFSSPARRATMPANLNPPCMLERWRAVPAPLVFRDSTLTPSSIARSGHHALAWNAIGPGPHLSSQGSSHIGRHPFGQSLFINGRRNPPMTVVDARHRRQWGGYPGTPNIRLNRRVIPVARAPAFILVCSGLAQVAGASAKSPMVALSDHCNEERDDAKHARAGDQQRRAQPCAHAEKDHVSNE